MTGASFGVRGSYCIVTDTAFFGLKIVKNVAVLCVGWDKCLILQGMRLLEAYFIREPTVSLEFHFNKRKMKVLKFGGTSLGSVEGLNNVKSIVERQHEPVVVVVSAMSKITNKLVELATAAQEGDTERCDKLLESIYQRHYKMIGCVIENRIAVRAVRREVRNIVHDKLRAACNRLLAGGLDAQETAHTRNLIVTSGEMMSSVMVSVMLHAHLEVSTYFVKTNATPDGDKVNEELTAALIVNKLRNRTEPVIVVQGFVAQDCATLATTTLGRGGSDYTAALIAAALDAKSLEIWTDVDGFMTADPRKSRHAKVIPNMTYEEAQEMCDAGAKVIYPPTIRPVALKNIPVWVKNTFNPMARGTRIADKRELKPEDALLSLDEQIKNDKQYTFQWD